MVEIVQKEEYYYDSLDDSLENSDESIKNVRTAVECPKDTWNSEDEDDISTIVPFYSGDTYKKNMGVHKTLTSSDNQGLSHCRPSKLNECKKRIFKCVEEKQKQNSYLSLFHSRIGYPSGDRKINITDTSRAIEGDSTFRTVSSHDSKEQELFQDAQEEGIDTER